MKNTDLFIFNFIFFWGPFLFANTLDITSLPTLVDLNNPEFQDIGITEFVSLDSYEPKASIAGVRLQCHDDNNAVTRPARPFWGVSIAPKSYGKIMFCEGGCDEPTTPESSGPTVSIECANYLDQAIRKCVEAMGCVSNIRFCDTGGHAKRKMNTTDGGSTAPSRHSSGDALDLFDVHCMKADGSQLKLPLTNNGRKKNTDAYDAFVKCWRDSMENAKPRAEGHKGAIACTSAEPPKNSLHDNHVHLSCPTPRQKTKGT